MKTTLRAALLAAFFAWSSATTVAITLTNKDRTEQKLTVIEGDKQTDRLLKPAETIDFCAQGCVIRLGETETYEFEGKEIVSLEEGLLFLDEAEPAATQVPDPEQREPAERK